MPATDARHADPGASLGRLLEAWQASGDPARFEPLVAAARPLIERTAAHVLRRHEVADPTAVDDVVSLVFDHLRRLPGPSPGERLVSCFTPRPYAQDDGLGYLTWLTGRRAMDVVRDRRRCHREARCFVEIAPAELAGLTHAGPAAADDEAEEACRRLHAAIARLAARQRLVVELLLAGKSQAAIAHLLDVCEGSVSRLRSKAVESLRRLLAE